MTDNEAFQSEQVIKIINNILISNPNTCELKYLIALREELENKLKEYNGE